MKALKEMQDRGEVEGKVSGSCSETPIEHSTKKKKLTRLRHIGKQSVYHAIQDPVEDLSPEQITKLNEEIETLRSNLASVKGRERELRSEISVLNAHVSTTDLQDIIAKLETERNEVLARLVPMRENSASARIVSVDEKAGIEHNWLIWKKMLLRRKKICREMWERCTEVLPEGTTKEEMWESLGLESAF